MPTHFSHVHVKCYCFLSIDAYCKNNLRTVGHKDLLQCVVTLNDSRSSQYLSPILSEWMQ